MSTEENRDEFLPEGVEAENASNDDENAEEAAQLNDEQESESEEAVPSEPAVKNSEEGSEGEEGQGPTAQAQCGDEEPAPVPPKKKKAVGHWIVIIVLCILLFAAMGSCSSNSAGYNSLSEDYNTLYEQYTALEAENETLEGEIEELEAEIEELEGGAAAQLVEIKNAYEEGDWQTVIDLAAVLHESYNGSDEDIEAQELAEKSQAKLDEEAEAAAEEEAKGYETGITYEDLARYPDDYYGEKVKFEGKVIQSVEEDDSYTIRLAIDSDYDQVVIGYFAESILESRILEDDIITVYGYSLGTISYESVLGSTITVPGIYIQKIDQ